MLHGVAGVPKSTGPLSDGGSSLKSLEYSQVMRSRGSASLERQLEEPRGSVHSSQLSRVALWQALNLTAQELAWQAQRSSAAAAAADPEMTTAEIGRAPEYHVDFQNDKKRVKELQAAQVSPALGSQRLPLMVQATRLNRCLDMMRSEHQKVGDRKELHREKGPKHG